jgi:hypothetical protein
MYAPSELAKSGEYFAGSSIFSCCNTSEGTLTRKMGVHDFRASDGFKIETRVFGRCKSDQLRRIRIQNSLSIQARSVRGFAT